MAWRVMRSIDVLFDQLDAIAPNRSRASDGTIGDTAHQGTTSDHNPHYVAGVGSEIVTAGDYTHDPAGGCDAHRLAEVLRVHRDRRIEYVISNKKIFSSYRSGSRAPWAWGPYTGSNPHDKHTHVSTLDNPVSDTSTPWNLEGLDMDDPNGEYLNYLTAERQNKVREMASPYDIKAFTSTSGKLYPAIPGEVSKFVEAIRRVDAAVAAMATAEQVLALTAAVEKLDADVQALAEEVRSGTGAAGTYDISSGRLTIERVPEV